MTIEIYQVDAFTSTAFSGNPAAVCLLEKAADTKWMQRLALEMNLSETAFLVARDGDFDLRWFTPFCEVDLCGHATLASAHVLWESGRLAHGADARFHTLSGLLTARRLGSKIELDFPAEPPEASASPQDLLPALGIGAAAYVGRNRMDYLVELASEEEVRALEPDFRRLSQVETRGVIVTSRCQADRYDFVSRFFAPQAGVDEDPVTGSAHCCLGPYWAGKLDKEELRAFQASPRGGEMTVRLSADRVLLAGHAVTVVNGQLAPSALPPNARSESEEADMDDRKTYQQKAEEQFERMGSRIDDLLGRVEDKARSGYQKVGEEVRQKRSAAGARLGELKSSSGDAWEELKPGFEKAWQDLRQAFEKAVEAFGR